MVKTFTESDLIDCFHCPNFWADETDENLCDQCNGHKTIADIPPVMPPLIIEREEMTNENRSER